MDPLSDDEEAPQSRVLLGPSPADADVERVCKLVADLSTSSGGAMEAALDTEGVTPNLDLVAAVLARFRQLHSQAQRFFRWAASHPSFGPVPAAAYDAMVDVFANTRQFESLASLLDEAGAGGALSMDAAKVAFKAFVAARQMKKARDIFFILRRYNLDSGIETFNSLLEVLAKSKLAKEAYQLFDKMRDQYPPNLSTYTMLLLGYCRSKNLVGAAKVWNEILDNGFEPDIVAHNTLLEGMLLAQQRAKAVQLFEVMKAKGPLPNTMTYTLLIHDHCKRKNMDLAVQRFTEMRRAGFEPNVSTYTCMILGFGNSRQMDKVSTLIQEMKDNGCLPDHRVYNALIKLTTSQGMPDVAAKICIKMIKHGFEPSVNTYNALMKSYFNVGSYTTACAVWDEMATKGVLWDVNSYTVVINGHVRHGRHEEARRCIEEMISKGMKAPQIDYNKFAADFSRAGKPEVLYELAQQMSFSGNFDAAHVFRSWAEKLKNRVKRRGSLDINPK